MNNELIWDRWCTQCGWRGQASDLILDESAESFYRCPKCGTNADAIKEEQWHIGNKIYRG